MPYFCLSWVLTWLSHDLKSLELITRLFDFFLSGNPILPVYFSAHVLTVRKHAVMGLLKSDISEDANLHSFLQRFPDRIHQLDEDQFSGQPPLAIMDQLIHGTWDLFERYPPRMLQRLHGSVQLGSWSVVNRYTHDLEPFEFGYLGYGEDEIELEEEEVELPSRLPKQWRELDLPLNSIRRVLQRAVDDYEHRDKAKERQKKQKLAEIKAATKRTETRLANRASTLGLTRTSIRYAVFAASAAALYYLAADQNYQYFQLA